MKEINILPPIVYNRLAAGEVVENPASIVKELVENSLDAGAHKITVQIVNGGIDEIVVIDDGEGVDQANLSKVFLPHATSKIKNLTDIDHIASLGFRGEAMASIAAVAKVEFTSKPREQDYAASINDENEIKMVGGNNGTTVRVANLFYNTPARRKFLRSSSIERNNVTQTIHDFIFANPDLIMRYIVDGKVMLDYNGKGLSAAMAQIFDISQQELLTVDYQEPDLAVKGFISNMRLSKPNRDRQVVVVNGRVVNGGLPAAVVNETMANYLPVKEYPIFVLHLTIATDKVDVNVHPQKKEVRFEDKEKLTTFVRSAISHTLDKFFMGQIDTMIKPVELPKLAVATPPKVAGKSFVPNQEPVAETVLFKSLDLLNDTQPAVKCAPNILNNVEVEPVVESAEQVTVLPQNSFKVLGQVFETYLLVSTAENLLIIDQHAMAERINYDKFRKEIDTDAVKTQVMLAPLIINLSPQELSKYEKIKPLLTSFGFDCDLFGESAIRISAIPAVMSNSRVKDFLMVLLDDKEIVDASLSDTVKHKVATSACKASLKAGEVLSHEQIEYFLANYFANKNIPLCPHGRPIMLVYPKSKLESLFARR